VTFPRPTDLAAAARATGLLLRTRRQMVRDLRARALLTLGMGVLLSLLFLAANVGYLLRRAAETGAGSPGTEAVVNTVVGLESGALGTIGAVTLGSVFASALISPFVGMTIQALTSAEDLSVLRPPRLHRYFDALITAATSTVGLMQVVSLTLLASLLTINSGHAGAILLAWATFPVVLLVTTALGWGIELVMRTWGSRVRRILAVILALLVGGGLLLDPRHGQTMFGLGTFYSAALRAPGAGDTATIVWALLGLVTVAVIAFVAGVLACQAALTRPAVPQTIRRTTRRRMPLSRHRRIALLQILAAGLLRTPDVRRALGTVLVMGIPGIALTGGSATSLLSVAIAAPLSTALIWGSNAFGVLGQGMTWLATQPNVLRWLLPLTALVQAATVATLIALTWLPAALFGSLDARTVASVTAAAIVSTAFVTRSAAAKAVRHPTLVRQGTRGDVIMPPMRALNYTVRFMVLGGAVATVTYFAGDDWLRLGLVFGALIWTAARFWWLRRAWRDRVLQARVVATVSAA
jgi:hypothetical protein